MASEYFDNYDLSSAAGDSLKKGGNNQDGTDKTVPLTSENDWGQTPSREPIPPFYGRGPEVRSAGNRGLRGAGAELTEISLPPSVRIDPAVGWLVCVDGVDKGRSFRLVKGNNPIGRPGNGKQYAVSLTDQAISRKGAAGVIVYNEKSNQFFITPGDLTTNINPYLNEEILLSPKLLNARATLEIAGDILIFVPFCSDKFAWKFEAEEEEKKTERVEKVPSSGKGGTIVRCDRGHFYNSAMHDSCPYCAAESAENDPDGQTKIF